MTSALNYTPDIKQEQVKYIINYINRWTKKYMTAHTQVHFVVPPGIYTRRNQEIFHYFNKNIMQMHKILC